MATVPGTSNVVPMLPEWAKPTQADFLQAAAIMHEKEQQLAFNTSEMRRSENIEDTRASGAKWGGSFGEKEGGPPAGVNPDKWAYWKHVYETTKAEAPKEWKTFGEFIKDPYVEKLLKYKEEPFE